MISSRGALVVVLSSRCRSKIEQKRVKDRVDAGLCLMKQTDGTKDDLVECTNPAIGQDKRPVASRGCCSACYQAFTDHRNTLSPEEAVQTEQDAIARGWILAPQESRTIKSKYAFKKRVS